ncbi:MAG: hypothetical protein K2H29_00865 [Oscillospiraceae bacterium]|nr:hypothetical protein [Oscillospiraceae bacterium]
MMPVWLQVIAVFCPALTSFFMGIALIPFLKNYFKLNLKSAADSESCVYPTMCGVLLLFGTITGLVLSFALYQQFSGADRTGITFQMESRAVCTVLGYSLLMGFVGLFQDNFKIRVVIHKNQRKLIDPVRKLWKFLAVFLINMVFVRMLPAEIRNFPDVVNALLLAGFWQFMQFPEQETDGVSITMGMIQFLCLSMLFLAQKQNLCAIFSFSAAGASMGCLFWNLHPAKCRLGQVGTFWFGAAVPALCLMTQKMTVFCLYLAVYVLNFLPALFRKFQKQQFMILLQRAGCKPGQRIAILSGFALFCCALAIITQI